MRDEINYFSLNDKRMFEKGYYVNLQVNDQGISLNNTKKYSVKNIIRYEDIKSNSTINDFVIGSNGLIYILDDKDELWEYDTYSNRAEKILNSNNNILDKNSCIAFSRDIMYVGNLIGTKKLLAFSRSNGQIVWSHDELEGFKIYALAVAADRNQNLYVILPKETNRNVKGEIEVLSNTKIQIIKFNSYGRKISVFENDELRIKRKIKLSYLRNMFSIHASKNGHIYVLDSLNKSILEFSKNTSIVNKFKLDLEVFPCGIVTDLENNIYLGDLRDISSDIEDDRFILKFNSKGEFVEKNTGFRGKVEKLLMDSKNNIYALNKERNSIHIFELKKQMLKMNETDLPRGIYFSQSIDSKELGNIWHKILLNIDIPEDTQINFSYFCSDSKVTSIEDGKVDLDKFIKDITISEEDKINYLDKLWSKPMINPKDALVNNAKGRYFWFKIDFIGSKENTPTLKKVRVYYPRISYLRYLPEIYQKDEKSKDFLERFLGLFETFFMNMEEQISQVSKYFDIDAVSGGFLRWLSQWMEISANDEWDDEKVRRFVKKAPYLYKNRGTRQGIEKIVEIYTGEKPFIIEYFQIKYLKDKQEFKELMQNLYTTDPYCFCVIIRQGCIKNSKQKIELEKIINQEKPAFTEVKIVILNPLIYLDFHTYLGINTYLSETSLLRLNGKATLPHDTLIVDVDLDNRIEKHSRLGFNSELK